MTNETAFCQAMQEHPENNSLRLIFADWLEERGDHRGELIRLLYTLTQSVDVPDRSKLEDRLRSLLASGAQSVGPFLSNSVGMKFAWIPAGTFLMGSPLNEEERGGNETQHRATLTKGFYMGIYPVTQTVWRAVMGNNPSHFKGVEDLPVEQVSWNDCQEFLRKLSDRERHSYRLPTEAEWEFGCRAGTTTPFYFGNTLSTDQANYDYAFVYGKGEPGISREKKATPVGIFPPNGWGLYDMHGNVWEWCADWYEEDRTGELVDPQGPSSGESRILRGGSFDYYPAVARSAFYLMYEPSFRFWQAGFRVATTFP